jgi:hypothetical protein
MLASAVHYVVAIDQAKANSPPATRSALSPLLGASCVPLGFIASRYLDPRQRVEDRIPRRCLRAGKMEGHRQVHHRRRIAFRPDAAVHQRQLAQLAYQLHLSAVRIHQVPFRPRALLYAAGVGRGGARQYRPVHQHDGSTPQRRNKSGVAGTFAYFDAGTDQNIPFGCN